MLVSEVFEKDFGEVHGSYRLSIAETNDCVVKAVMHAFNINYISAHRLCELKFYRKYREGVTLAAMLKTFTKYGKSFRPIGKKSKYGYSNSLYRIQNSKESRYNAKLDKYKKYKIKKRVNHTVKTFLKTFSTGNYIIIVKGHAIAVVDGLVKSHPADKKSTHKQIIYAFKVS